MLTKLLTLECMELPFIWPRKSKNEFYIEEDIMKKMMLYYGSILIEWISGG